MGGLWQDVKFGVRVLAKNPAFTATAVGTLALAIGANTAVFSLIDPLLLRKLPVRDPSELVLVHAAGPLGSENESELSTYEIYRDKNRVFSGVVATRGCPKVLDLVSGGHTENAQVELVSGNYFSLLGVRPVLGRLLEPDDDRGARGNAAVVLSFESWRRWFGADEGIVGKTIGLHGVPYTVVGITPPEFFGVEVGRSPDIYLSLASSRAIAELGWVGQWVTIIGRLKPGIALAQARADLEPLLAEGMRQSGVPGIEQQQMMARLVLTPAARGLDELRERYSMPARILMGVVAFILLIACANVANLFLERGIVRRKELMVRLALGAGRMRLLRQLLTESALVALAGGVMGMLAALWTSRMLLAALSTRHSTFTLKSDLDGRVLIFAAAVLVLATLLSGVVPALFSTRGELSRELKVQAATSGRAQGRLSKALVVAQVASSVTLLAAAGLLAHSLINLKTFDVGFRRDAVLVVSFATKPGARAPEQVRTLYDTLLGRVKELPRVHSASLSALTPISGGELGVNVVVDGDTRRSEQEKHASFTAVTPAYFETMGIPLLAGRDFTEQDAQGTVAIINRTMARHYFGDHNPIGKRFRFVEGNRPPMEIVGLVEDSRYKDIRETTPDYVYLPKGPRATLNTTLLVRTEGDAKMLVVPVRELVGSFSGSISVENIETLREQIDESLHQDRLAAALCGVFSGLALLLTSVGLFGLLSFSVARRTSEIGLRMALGAQRHDVLRLVAADGMRLVFAGLVIGAAGAAAAVTLLKGMLFQVKSADPLALGGVAVLLTLTGLLACYLPARRAARIDPMQALRSE